MSEAVFLVGFGGPAKREEVRPFLDNVLRGRPVPPARYEEVVRQYDEIGGASPYTALTFQLADALRAKAGLPVYVGMRNWDPYLGEALARMKSDGVDRAAGVVLSTFVSEPSWDRYRDAVTAVHVDGAAPKISYAAPWPEDARFIAAAAARVAEAAEKIPAARRAGAHWIFTAHSIPVPADRESDYSGQVRRAAERIARELKHDDWSVAFQSRSGRPQDPWLEPDIGDAIRALPAGRDVLAMPLGFLSDHVEVLFDLDRKAKAAADASGHPFFRAATVGTHPLFVELLAERVRETLSQPKAAK